MWPAAGYKGSAAGVAHRATMSAPDRSRNSSAVIADAGTPDPRVTKPTSSTQASQRFRVIDASFASALHWPAPPRSLPRETIQPPGPVRPLVRGGGTGQATRTSALQLRADQP